MNKKKEENQKPNQTKLNKNQKQKQKTNELRGIDFIGTKLA